MKLGEVVATHVYYNFTKFHQNRMKNKKVLLIDHFSVQNFKALVESWKSYSVQLEKNLLWGDMTQNLPEKFDRIFFFTRQTHFI